MGICGLYYHSDTWYTQGPHFVWPVADSEMLEKWLTTAVDSILCTAPLFNLILCMCTSQQSIIVCNIIVSVLYQMTNDITAEETHESTNINW